MFIYLIFVSIFNLTNADLILRHRVQGNESGSFLLSAYEFFPQSLLQNQFKIAYLAKGSDSILTVGAFEEIMEFDQRMRTEVSFIENEEDGSQTLDA